MPLPPPTPDELAGRALYGDSLDPAGIAQWFASEQQAYFDLADDYANNPTGAVHRHHALPHLPPGRFPTALALGAADGGEYGAFTGLVERFIAVEPGRGFWRDSIAGARAEYRMPTTLGTLDLPDASLDLACAFGVLHHIPNVSAVLRELARALKPGAPLVLREPIASLGDFRVPRPGLTAHERGIAHALMDTMLDQAGFALAHKSFANLPPLQVLARRAGMKRPWDSPAFVAVDALLSRAMAWNARYWRPRLRDKLAPATAYWVALRRPLS